jgi:tryptophan-rich sensory protein
MSADAIVALSVFVLACAAAATPGVIFRPGGWYRALAKPPWCPPDWVFGPVWTVLYLTVAVSGWLVWRQSSLGDAPAAFVAYGLQLALNGLWSTIFFGLRRPDLAFVEIVFLWLSILATIAVFHPISPTASYLLIPYACWVSFAVALNFSVWRLNPVRAAE